MLLYDNISSEGRDYEKENYNYVNNIYITNNIYNKYI